MSFSEELNNKIKAAMGIDYIFIGEEAPKQPGISSKEQSEYFRSLIKRSDKIQDDESWDYCLVMEYRDDNEGLSWKEYFKYNALSYFPDEFWPEDEENLDVFVEFLWEKYKHIY